VAERQVRVAYAACVVSAALEVVAAVALPWATRRDTATGVTARFGGGPWWLR
jgi:hypothetical protein